MKVQVFLNPTKTEKRLFDLDTDPSHEKKTESYSTLDISPSQKNHHGVVRCHYSTFCEKLFGD